MAYGQKTGGRQKGTPNKFSLATWQRVEKEADPIGFLTRVANGEAIEAATDEDAASDQVAKVLPTLNQRIAAATKLAQWMPPPPKVRPIAMELPEMTTPGDIVEVIGAVVEHMAAGDITPDEAETIAKVVEVQRRAVELEDIDKRLAALEADK